MLYPIGIQNFEDLRKSGYTYVDKTSHIYRMISTGKYYFLSRPSSFGKSLLLSTMDAYFKAKKELFRGLAKYGIASRYSDASARFKDIIDAAYEKSGRQVVILIDEYDKPIVNNLDNQELSDYYRAVLQGFYSVIKSKDGQIRFCILTGVSKIGKMSVFSTLNNLKDMYDGYHFTDSSLGVYNPFSLLNAFSDREFKDYDNEFKEYTLGFPNDEVKNGFLKFIYSYYVPVNPAEGSTTTGKLARALRAGDPDLFMKILEALFANTTYQIQGDSEKDFQYAMYIIMELLGEYVEAERHTSNGRIDLLLQTKDYIYIVELKVNSTAEVALQQIEEKGYAKPFVDDPRKLFKIGVSFSTADRRVDDWRVVC